MHFVYMQMEHLHVMQVVYMHFVYMQMEHLHVM